jgi:hypothetical protein
MSENITPGTEEFAAQEAAEKAMADIMADSTKLLTNYLRLNAARITAERELEELAKEQWAAWRALTSSKKGGFTEAQLKRQAITAPAPVPRRDRGKKRTTKTTAPSAPVVEQASTEHPEHGGSHYGG